MGHSTIVTPTPQGGFQTHTVAHHFKTAEQEFQSAKLGFCQSCGLFLVHPALILMLLTAA